MAWYRCSNVTPTVTNAYHSANSSSGSTGKSISGTASVSEGTYVVFICGAMGDADYSATPSITVTGGTYTNLSSDSCTGHGNNTDGVKTQLATYVVTMTSSGTIKGTVAYGGTISDNGAGWGMSVTKID